MNKTFDHPEDQISKDASTCTWWRLGPTGWILILGLIAVNMGVLFENVSWNQHTLGWFLFHLDPRHWPLWPIPLLWGTIAWLICNALDPFDFVKQKKFRIRLGIVFIVFCWVAWLIGWFFHPFRLWKLIYYQIYIAYIMGPISIYLSDGTTSWKLVLSPLLAAGTLTLLLWVAYQQRRKK